MLCNCITSMNMWDQRYNTPEYFYGKEPNAFFANELKKLDPGMLLLPAEGEGRNAVYAASIGWEVHAFDSSKVAREKALRLAAERKVNILFTISNVQDFDTEKFKYDAIGLIYTHFPFEMRHDFFQEIQTYLAPDGKIILEGFHKKQLHLTTGGPKDPTMLFSTDELEKNFDQLHFEYLKTETIDLAESDGHNGEAEVVRMVGTKKQQMTKN